jgi:hypothetical protein
MGQKYRVTCGDKVLGHYQGDSGEAAIRRAVGKAMEYNADYLREVGVVSAEKHGVITTMELAGVE